MSRSPPSWMLPDTVREERLMKTKTTPRRLRPQARSFVDCLREFLTPALAPGAHVGAVAPSGAAGRRRRLLRLRVDQAPPAAEGQLPFADVLERHAVHGEAGGPGR